MEINHFSHKHTLIFNEDLQQNEGQNLSCFGCKEPIFGLTYSCKLCNFFFHKACAELPRKISHTFHRRHPLILQEHPPHHDLPYLCNCCGNVCGSFVYHCSLCNFNLDMKCASIPCALEPVKNEHHVIWLMESRIPYFCDFCGGDGSVDSYAYLCTRCQILVHSDCKGLPFPEIETTKHEHWLDYRFSLMKMNLGTNTVAFAVMNEIITDHGCYYCSECNYVSHIGCGFDNFINHTKSVEAQPEYVENDEEIEYEASVLDDDKSMDLITRSTKEIYLEDDEIAMETDHFSNQQFSLEITKDDGHEQCDKCKLSISAPNAHCHLKHFSHKHPLFFSEEHQIEQTPCSLCENLVLSPSYSCSQCNFLLHKSCAELPRNIKHPFHRKHPLTLATNSYYGCCICSNRRPCMAYCCSYCDWFSLDIKCAGQPCVIEPEAHQHQFIHWMRAIPFTCNACGKKESEQTPYFCTICQVKVHKNCISLPNAIKITQHDHLLTRNHFFHENVLEGSLNCGVCHGEVNFEYGSYHCPDCNYIAHVSCVLALEDKDHK